MVVLGIIVAWFYREPSSDLIATLWHARYARASPAIVQQAPLTVK